MANISLISEIQDALRHRTLSYDLTGAIVEVGTPNYQCEVVESDVGGEPFGIFADTTEESARVLAWCLANRIKERGATKVVVSSARSVFRNGKNGLCLTAQFA